MTDDELVRKTALLNCEIIITHGLTEGGVGFEWHGLFIHDPFADPQYGAFPVDPVQQYGDAYTGSIFVSRANSLPRVDARSGTRKTPAGLSIRRAQPLALTGPRRLRAGRHFPGNEEALLVGFTSVHVPPAAQLPQGVAD
jgi:hypothetical protein